jgi:hypothetical protein
VSCLSQSSILSLCPAAFPSHWFLQLLELALTHCTIVLVHWSTEDPKTAVHTLTAIYWLVTSDAPNSKVKIIDFRRLENLHSQ